MAECWITVVKRSKAEFLLDDDDDLLLFACLARLFEVTSILFVLDYVSTFALLCRLIACAKV